MFLPLRLLRLRCGTVGCTGMYRRADLAAALTAMPPTAAEPSAAMAAPGAGVPKNIRRRAAAAAKAKK